MDHVRTEYDRHRQARRARRAGDRRHLRRLWRRDDEPRPPARPLQGHGRSRAAQLARSCAPRRLRRALRSRMAELAGRRRLRRLPRRQRHLRADAGAGLVLADEESPVFIPNAWAVPASMWSDEDKAVEAFRTGKGIAGATTTGGSIAASPRSTATATGRASSPSGCRRSTASSTKLEAGARVADIGCGHGHSTVLMAEAFPDSRFHGFDTHPESIARPGRSPPRPASPQARPSRRPARTTIAARATT